jgi:hypothetical protein
VKEAGLTHAVIKSIQVSRNQIAFFSRQLPPAVSDGLVDVLVDGMFHGPIAPGALRVLSNGIAAGFLPKIQSIKLRKLDLNDEDFEEFMRALEQAYPHPALQSFEFVEDGRGIRTHISSQKLARIAASPALRDIRELHINEYGNLWGQRDESRLDKVEDELEKVREALEASIV